MRRAAAVADRDEVVRAVRGAIGIVLERDAASLAPETTFAELGADSLALVEFADLVEAELRAGTRAHVHIDDASLAGFATLGDAVDYLVARL